MVSQLPPMPCAKMFLDLRLTGLAVRPAWALFVLATHWPGPTAVASPSETAERVVKNSTADAGCMPQ